MHFVTWGQISTLASGAVAIGTGLAGSLVTLWGQLPPIQASPTQIDNLTTAIGGGAVAIIFYGATQILTVILKPIIADRTQYWEDKQKQRDYEERKLKLQYESEERKQKLQQTLQKNGWNTREMYEWIAQAAARNPSLPKAPEWIAMHDTAEHEQPK